MNACGRKLIKAMRRGRAWSANPGNAADARLLEFGDDAPQLRGIRNGLASAGRRPDSAGIWSPGLDG